MRFDSAAADRLTSVVLFALGAAMLIGGYTMDRLEIRQIHPASIPGLVPMVLGGSLMLCAALLFTSAERRARGAAPEAVAGDSGVSWSNLLATAVLSTVFALVLVGRLPFFVSSALYITVFIAYFSWPRGAGGVQKLKVSALAVTSGVVASASIALLFRYGFLVRLP